MSSFIFKIGKHKGKSLQFVEKIDPSYIKWARENAPNLLEEYKPKIKLIEPAPRKEPPEESEVPKSALQPNINFLNEGPNGSNPPSKSIDSNL